MLEASPCLMSDVAVFPNEHINMEHLTKLSQYKHA